MSWPSARAFSTWRRERPSARALSTWRRERPSARTVDNSDLAYGPSIITTAVIREVHGNYEPFPFPFLAFRGLEGKSRRRLQRRQRGTGESTACKSWIPKDKASVRRVPIVHNLALRGKTWLGPGKSKQACPPCKVERETSRGGAHFLQSH